ncbi:MAG: class I SAM-dependent methyltransferase [Acidimicrobiales bacterium]
MVATSRGRRRTAPPRRLLARHLVGSGIEVGPGHHPFELPMPGVEVRYVDRWKPSESGELFPQFAAERSFTEPDVIADFNSDRLGPIGDASQDFVIASHVLEHLAEPIGFIAEIHRVLRPGGIALILLPDRHRTNDRGRDPTALSHLVSEYEAKVDEVSEAHVVEWLRHKGKPVGDTRPEQLQILDYHRRRSIHVHCWDASEFLEVIRWGIENLAEEWEFVDGSAPRDEFPTGIEFSFVLRRSTTPMDPVTRSRRFESAWTDWNDARASAGLTAREDWSIRALRKVRRELHSRLSIKSRTKPAS